MSQTERGYDLIAGKFSQTRKHFWRELEFVKDFIRPGMKVLDYGCGNGRLAGFLSEEGEIDYVGADVSERLLEEAQKSHIFSKITPADTDAKSQSRFEFVKLDPQNERLPWNDGIFDAVFSVAVFHHFPSSAYRKRMAGELCRVLKRDGIVVITVWNLWQPKYRRNIFRNWRDKLSGRSELDWNDCSIPFADNEGRRFERFHHAFTKRELRKLFAAAGFRVEKCEIISGRNIALVGRKEK